MSGWKASDPEISWFWRALRSFSQEERARFLMFVTSSSRVPLGGFTQLQGSSGTQPFQIQRVCSPMENLRCGALTPFSSIPEQGAYLKPVLVSTFCYCPNTNRTNNYEKSFISRWLKLVDSAKHDASAESTSPNNFQSRCIQIL
jgi:hypothetical protein